MSATEIHEGGCLCGAVRWRARGTPKNVNHCHCEMCRRSSGAAFLTFATFATADVEFPGKPPTWRQSSAIARRGFCSSCGAALAWQSLKETDSIDLTVGTADEPARLAPREHLWTGSAISWLHMDDDLPRHKRQRGT